MECIWDTLISQKTPRIAVCNGDESISYIDLYRIATETGKKFPTGKSSTVGMYLPNGVLFIEALLAIWSIRKIPVPLSILETIDQVSESIEFTDQYMVITNEEKYHELKIKLNDLKRSIYLYNIESGECERINPNLPFPIEKDKLDPFIAAVILKTSGTTDNPKYTILTHRGLLFNARAHIRSLGLCHDDITLIQLPMCFGYCFSSQMLAHLLLNATLCFITLEFSPALFLAGIQKYNITNTTVVPPMLVVLERYLKLHGIDYNLSRFRLLCFGGAKMNIAVIKACKALMPNVCLAQTYGLTEHSPRITTKVYENSDEYNDDVGLLLEGVSLQIKERWGEKLPPGEIGEIWVKSPSVMLRYYANPNETARVIRDGWLDTGDVGYQDEQKRLYIVGRKKNIIIRNGININPEIIENCILQDSYVRYVRVIGEEHPVYGENPIAEIVLNPNTDTQKAFQSIHQLCKEQLPTYMLPSELRFVENLPITITGKVKR